MGSVDKAVNLTSTLLCVGVKTTSIEAGGGHRETSLRDRHSQKGRECFWTLPGHGTGIWVKINWISKEQGRFN